MIGLIKSFLCLLVAVQLTTGLTVPTSTTTAVDRRCPLYYFYDYGTEHCEFCCDICCHAERKSTTKQCDSECPEYAKKLRNEDRNILDNRQNLQNPGQDQNAEHTQAGGLPIAAQIGIPVVGCFIFLFLVGLAYAKRKVIVELFRKQQTPTGNVADDPAAIPLREIGSPDTDSRQLDIDLEDQGEQASLQPGPPTEETPEGRAGPKVMAPSGALRVATRGEGVNGNRRTGDHTLVKVVPN
ncbi:hypothetical protein ACOMHN_061147 [Nucella lapillus]